MLGKNVIIHNNVFNFCNSTDLNLMDSKETSFFTCQDFFNVLGLCYRLIFAILSCDDFSIGLQSVKN